MQLEFESTRLSNRSSKFKEERSVRTKQQACLGAVKEAGLASAPLDNQPRTNLESTVHCLNELALHLPRLSRPLS